MIHTATETIGNGDKRKRVEAYRKMKRTGICVTCALHDLFPVLTQHAKQPDYSGYPW